MVENSCCLYVKEVRWVTVLHDRTRWNWTRLAMQCNAMQHICICVSVYLCICVFVYLCICLSWVYLCIVCSAEVAPRPQWRWCRSHQNHQLHQLACIRHTVSTLRARRTGWDPRWAMSVASLRFSQDSVPYGHWYCAPGCFQSTSSCTGVSPNTIEIVWSFKLDEASRCSANKDF